MTKTLTDAIKALGPSTDVSYCRCDEYGKTVGAPTRYPSSMVGSRVLVTCHYWDFYVCSRLDLTAETLAALRAAGARDNETPAQ